MDNFITTKTISPGPNLPARESKYSWNTVKKALGKLYAFFYGNPPAIIGNVFANSRLGWCTTSTSVIDSQSRKTSGSTSYRPRTLNIFLVQLAAEETCTVKCYTARESR